MSERAEHGTGEEVDIFTAYTRPNRITEGYELAKIYQQMINDLTGDPDEIREQARQAVADLDSECNHCYRQIMINGHVMMRAINIAGMIEQSDEEGILLSPTEQTSNMISEKEVYVEDLLAQSLGYVQMSVTNANDGTTEKTKLYHVAITDPRVVAEIPAAGRLTQQMYIFMSIDSKVPVDVRLTADDEEPNLPLLQFYADEIMADIDEGVLNATSLTEAVRALSEVRLTETPSLAVDPSITQELVKYASQALGMKNNAYYQLTDINRIYLEDGVDPEDGATTYILHELPEGKTVTGPMQLLSLGGANTEIQFGLSTIAPMTDGTQRGAVIALTNHIRVKELDTLNII